MSLTEIIIKIIGIALAIIGFLMIIGAVGVHVFGTIGVSPVWLSILLGVIFLGVGIYIVRGGTFVV